jgi:prevent-host-death family protein
MEVGIKEAKNSLSELISQVKTGNRVFVTNRGKRVIELVPVKEEKTEVSERGFGMFKDVVKLPAGFGTRTHKKEGTDRVLKLMGLK